MIPDKLTDAERLILSNQYEILGLLKKEDQYTLIAETLRDGYEWLYRQFFEHFSHNLPRSSAEHVLTILEIYSDLRCSYEKLTDKSGIDKHLVEFPGFDGNNEADLLGFAQALRKHDRFIETIGPAAKNSHMPTTEMYRRMIEAWNQLGKPRYPLTREQIIAILGARVHPENRK